jgi:hypothetical protein
MARRFPARTWVLLAVGTGTMLGGIVAVLFFAGSSVEVQSRTREQAFGEMDRVRERLGRAPPCLPRDGGGRESVTDSAASREASSPAQDQRSGERGTRAAPGKVVMLAWEREDDRLIRVTTPYWALRAGSWKLNAARVIAPVLDRVSLADLDRCAPGLIVDQRTAGGGRVVIWTE